MFWIDFGSGRSFLATHIWWCREKSCASVQRKSYCRFQKRTIFYSIFFCYFSFVDHQCKDSYNGRTVETDKAISMQKKMLSARDSGADSLVFFYLSTYCDWLGCQSSLHIALTLSVTFNSLQLFLLLFFVRTLIYHVMRIARSNSRLWTERASLQHSSSRDNLLCFCRSQTELKCERNEKCSRLLVLFNNLLLLLLRCYCLLYCIAAGQGREQGSETKKVIIIRCTCHLIHPALIPFDMSEHTIISRWWWMCNGFSPPFWLSALGRPDSSRSECKGCSLLTAHTAGKRSLM